MLIFSNIGDGRRSPIKLKSVPVSDRPAVAVGELAGPMGWQAADRTKYDTKYDTK